MSQEKKLPCLVGPAPTAFQKPYTLALKPLQPEVQSGSMI